jgi:hypothetical protein
LLIDEIKRNARTEPIAPVNKITHPLKEGAKRKSFLIVCAGPEPPIWDIAASLSTSASCTVYTIKNLSYCYYTNAELHCQAICQQSIGIRAIWAHFFADKPQKNRALRGFRRLRGRWPPQVARPPVVAPRPSNPLRGCGGRKRPHLNLGVEFYAAKLQK